MINIWYIDKTAQKNADDYLSFYPTAINLSILDFKCINSQAVELEIVLYKSIHMDFKCTINIGGFEFNTYKSIHIGF